MQAVAILLPYGPRKYYFFRRVSWGKEDIRQCILHHVPLPLPWHFLSSGQNVSSLSGAKKMLLKLITLLQGTSSQKNSLPHGS